MNTDQFQQIVIIGGGICGLTTAYQIKKNEPKTKVIIIEKLKEVGGLARSTINGQGRFDIGSHRLHLQTDEKILSFIQDEIGIKLQKVPRRGQLRLLGKWLPYPLNIISFLKGLGYFESIRFAVSYFKIALKRIFYHLPENNYQDSLVKSVGLYAYKIFYHPYAIKVWNKDPKTISNSAVKKRVSTTNPLKYLLKSLFGQDKQNEAKFLYPEKGMGDLTDEIYRKILDMGVMIYTESVVEAIDHEGQILHIKEVGDMYFDKLISTIPVDKLFKLFRKIPSNLLLNIKNLEWRGLSLVYLSFDREILLPGETFYFPESKYIFGRVSVPKRFSQTKSGEKLLTTITCEIPGNRKNDDIEALTKLCIDQLKSIKLLPKNLDVSDIHSTWMHLEHLYPIYEIGWQKHLDRVFKEMKKNYPWLYPTGKMGLFLHSNIDHSIYMGLELGDLIHHKESLKKWYNLIPEFQEFKIRD